MNNRAGHLKTIRSGETAYQAFVPRPLPPVPPVRMTDDIVAHLIRAHSGLAVLDSVARRTPNAGVYVSMLVRKEALMSSQIEGIQATLEDAQDPQSAASANSTAADVASCIKAAEFAISRLKELPLCSSLIKQAHAVLMEGGSRQEKGQGGKVQGKDQEQRPGEFRHSQNWIGGLGSALQNASYIPPSPDDVAEAMSCLENYINADGEAGDSHDVLIRAALVHWQFETIHPFLDGNGRLGRLLVTLYLIEKKVLRSPALPLSGFLNRNRAEYYDRLSEVRRTGNYEQWVKFFLLALAESAEDAVSAIDELVRLRDKTAPLFSEWDGLQKMHGWCLTAWKGILSSKSAGQLCPWGSPSIPYPLQ